jgi:murein DD-endopeptidase MepM/ murein hydrolase activator NlpD
MKESQRGQVFDVSVGESVQVRTAGGGSHRMTLLEVKEPRCAARGVIRSPRITIDVDGERAEAPAAEYHMPQVVGGMRVACSVTRGIAEAVGRLKNVYALDKDARIRCWDLQGPLFGPTPLIYPARQRWFASMTQMANERCFVNACELPATKPGAYIYHHYGLDIGGHDRAVPIVAARGGRVVLRAEQKAADYDEAGGELRYDRVVVRDDAGWYYLYSHLDTIAPTVKLDGRVEAGDPIGVLGKEGSSGGWAHLHFGIVSPQPSGRYGQVEGYPFLVEAYLREHPGSLLACARPHCTAVAGEPVTLDGGRSICDGARIASFQWRLHDGEVVGNVRAVKTYRKEGMYSEMLTVTDERGRTDVDFCVVQILPADADPAKTPPAMHLTCYPTEGIVPGQPIAFKVRTFFGGGAFEANRAGEEQWDFGDGTTAVTCSGAPPRSGASTQTDFAERWHTYDKPGRYIVTVRRTGKNDLTATAQVKVEVEERAG